MTNNYDPPTQTQEQQLLQQKFQAQLQATFSSDEWPVFIETHKDFSSCQLTLSVHTGIRWFDGHFPDQPVLAGVVQTHWAGELGRWIFAIEDDFIGMENLKFQTVILPDKEVTLRFDYDREKKSLKFKYFDDESSYSEGKLTFAKG